MKTARRGPRTGTRLIATHLIVTGLIALAVGACTSPSVEPVEGRQTASSVDATALARQTEPAPPADPVKAASDAMEKRMQLILAAAHPGSAQ